MKKKRLSLIVVFLIALTASSYYYISDYYHVEETLLQQIDTDQTIEKENDYLVFSCDDPIAGLIFYPGAKVQFEAYAPLMQSLQQHHIQCILFHMPANLAILNQNIAKGIQEQYPEIKNWYIGGHSLGGVCASNYLYDHIADYDGLILLASYSTKDFSNSDLKAISIYGSNDGVLNLEKYHEAFHNLPENTIEYIIEGGNHAQFGDYGFQKNDHLATIPLEDQIEITTNQILELINP